MEVFAALKGGISLGVTLYLCHPNAIVTFVDAFPCSPESDLDGTTTGPCESHKTTTTPNPDSSADDSTEFLKTPYIFVILCTLVFLPFFILLKVWWVRKLQKNQYIRHRQASQGPEPEVYVVDPALFATPPSYEECMAQHPPFDGPPAYKDLKFESGDSPDVPSDGPSTSSSGGASLPQ